MARRININLDIIVKEIRAGHYILLRWKDVDKSRGCLFVSITSPLTITDPFFIRMDGINKQLMTIEEIRQWLWNILNNDNYYGYTCQALNLEELRTVLDEMR